MESGQLGARGFFAYPGGHPPIKDAILGAAELSERKQLTLFPWEGMNILGFKLDDLVRKQVADADVLLADVTYPNHNVFYELGFGIALGKPVIPTLSLAINNSVERIQQMGIFDNLGWLSYSNSDELSTALDRWSDVSWSNNYVKPKDHVQPLFVLDTLRKTDFRNHIFNSVENANVNYRSFDPSDGSRLSASKAITEISSSAGVILPLLGSDMVDNQFHNLRAAFLLGLCHGFDIEAMLIQYENSPVPLDYREYVTNSTFRAETVRHIENYCANVLIWNQKDVGRAQNAGAGILGEVDLGSPAAEQETQKLRYYFVETAEYSRALRAEGAIVVGRKGSGKTAVFFQVSEALGKDRRRCIVDLRPAAHYLSEMREALLSVANVGFDHTIAAFWQYIIYVEILLKMREAILPRSRNDFNLQERIRKVEDELSLSESLVSGDFTSRLDAAVRTVIRMARSADSGSELKSRLTNLMYEEPIPKLREAVSAFSDYFDEVVVLIDDLDKGWPPLRVEEHDVSTIRHLIEVLNRIRRDLSKRKTNLRHLVFLRSDIYELLVQSTSDRGKYNPIKVDWSDPEQLYHLLKQRVVSSVDTARQNEAWSAINPRMGKRDAIHEMIEGSLRRPRFLIDLCERTLSFAINRGHGVVEPGDVEEGLRQMSLYLVSDFGFEMRDVVGTPEGVFYGFIGKPELLTEGEVEGILSGYNLGMSSAKAVDLLLWYGFLGIARSSGSPIFIYDEAYDFRRLEAEIGSDRGEVLYAVNTAFLRGLRKPK